MKSNTPSSNDTYFHNGKNLYLSSYVTVCVVCRAGFPCVCTVNMIVIAFVNWTCVMRAWSHEPYRSTGNMEPRDRRMINFLQASGGGGGGVEKKYYKVLKKLQCFSYKIPIYFLQTCSAGHGGIFWTIIIWKSLLSMITLSVLWTFKHQLTFKMRADGA